MDDLDRVAARLLIALDLHDTGVDIMRHNVRRRLPGASEADIAAALRAWLHAKVAREDAAQETRPADEGTGAAGC